MILKVLKKKVWLRISKQKNQMSKVTTLRISIWLDFNVKQRKIMNKNIQRFLV